MMIVTIDGPAGAGKTSVSLEVAKRLNFFFLSTGSIYRAFALILRKKMGNKVLNQQEISKIDTDTLKEIANGMNIDFQIYDDSLRVYIFGEEFTQELKSEEVGDLASLISSFPNVRSALLGLQRGLARGKDVIAEGRDMGTVVFPWADLKIYIDASLEERAKRRYKELLERGVKSSLSKIFEEIKKRDERDRKREVSPLKVPHDAFFIDSTDMSKEEVIKKVLELINKKMGVCCDVK